MFDLTLSKQQLVTPLLTVAGVVDKKQSLAVLSNILMKIEDNSLLLTATDLEIEITAHIPCITQQQTGSITIPSKKIVDIVRSLDDDATVTISYNDNGALALKVARSSFKLSTISAKDYPVAHSEVSEIEFTIDRTTLLHLFYSTHFALTQQDVRFFLNGLQFK